MRLNHVYNARRNIVWGGLEKIVSILCPFLVRTLFIRVLGEEVLGLNSLFASILQVLNLAELGFANAIVYNMYKPIADNNSDLVCSLMNFFKKAYRVIGCIVLGVGLCLMPFLPHLISGSTPEGYNIYILYLIYLFNTSISYFLFAYRSCILTAYQRDDITSKVTLSLNIITYVLQFVIILLSKNYYFYILVLPLVTISSNIIKAVISKKIYPDYCCKGNLEEKHRKEIKKNITGLFIGKLCTISRNSFDNIFLSAFLGLTVVAIYSNYYYIMSSVIAILLMIGNAIRSGIGNRIALNSVEQNHKDFELLTFLYSWLSGWCAICLLCLYQPFMLIWVGAESMFPFYTVVQICIYFYSLTLGDIRTVYSNASGLFWENRFYVITEAVCNIVLNFILGKLWGVNGIIAATNISILGINFIWGSSVLYKYYFKNQKVSKFYITHLVYAIITALIGVATYFIINLIQLSGVIGFAIKALVCLVFPNIVYFVVYLRHPRINDAKLLIRRMMRGK